MEVVRNADNLGFPGGCNMAMADARTQDADFFFLLNPDASIEPSCAEELLRLLCGDQTLAAACPIILDQRSGLVWYAGAQFDLRHRRFGHIGLGERNIGQYDHVIETGRPTACAMMVRRAAINVIGLMDHTYFLYWEETEWALRFIQRGFRFGFSSAAEVRHLNANTTGGAGTPLYEYYYSRNELRFLAEATGRGRNYLIAQLAPTLVRRIISATLRHGLQRGFTIARAVFLAAADFRRDKNGQRPDLHQ